MFSSDLLNTKYMLEIVRLEIAFKCFIFLLNIVLLSFVCFILFCIFFFFFFSRMKYSNKKGCVREKRETRRESEEKSRIKANWDEKFENLATTPNKRRGFLCKYEKYSISRIMHISKCTQPDANKEPQTPSFRSESFKQTRQQSRTSRTVKLSTIQA